MRKAAVSLLIMIAAFAVAFAADQPAPPGEQDIYGPWEWAHWYHTQTQNNPYVPPSPSPWRKDWNIQADCSNGGGALVDGGGYAVRLFSNIVDNVIRPCHNWFDIESLTTYICPPAAICGDVYFQFELHKVLDDPTHGINWDPMLYQDGVTPVVIPPFKVIVGDVWYTQQVPHFHEGLPDEAPLFMQDTSFWVVVRPVGPTWPGTNVFMWHDPTATTLAAHCDARLIDNYDPDPDFYVFGEDLPPTNPYVVNNRHGQPLIAALVSKHAYLPAITSPTPAGRIPQGTPVNVAANIFCRTSPSYAGRWENRDYGPVHFWITTLDGSQTVYDQTIDPFLFPNPPLTANPLPAAFPQWDVNVPPGDYWMNCYNAFPYDWYTTNPSLKLDRKRITVYATDAAVSSIEQPAGSYQQGTWVVPKVQVINMGSEPASFEVRFWVPNTAYDGARRITDLAPGALAEVKFEELAASYAGRYEGHCRVYLDGDMNPANDELVSPYEVVVTSNPAGKACPTPVRQNVATAKTFTPRGEVALLANPVSRVARITVPGNVPISVDVYTAYGRLVKTFSTNECDISDLANGIYLMKVNAYSDTKMLRLVVEH